MKRFDLPEIISILLILMFSYATSSKIIDFHSFRIQLLIQPIPKWSVGILVYAIPISEILTVLFLMFKRTKTYGFYMAIGLMLMFCIYVGLAMTGAFGSIPCSCGGIIGHLTWLHHFIFNLIFLLLSIYGTIIDYRERRSLASKSTFLN